MFRMPEIILDQAGVALYDCSYSFVY